MSSSKAIKTGKGYSKIRVTENKALWLKQKIFHGLCGGAALTRPSYYYFTELAKRARKKIQFLTDSSI